MLANVQETRDPFEEYCQNEFEKTLESVKNDYGIQDLEIERAKVIALHRLEIEYRHGKVFNDPVLVATLNDLALKCSSYLSIDSSPEKIFLYGLPYDPCLAYEPCLSMSPWECLQTAKEIKELINNKIKSIQDNLYESYHLSTSTILLNK